MGVRKTEKGVSSKIEITRKRADGRSVSLKKYHSEISEMAKKIEAFAVKLEGENLLSVKMALMEAVRIVEEKLKMNREV